MEDQNMVRRRVSAVAMMIAGVLFLLYPAIRPFSDEVSLEGAAAFASTNWIVAHVLAMLAFTLLLFGEVGLVDSLRTTTANRLGYRALLFSVIGVGLTLPFYGGEAYGLHAVGIKALSEQNAALLNQATTIRSGAGLILFLLGLLLLAIGMVAMALAIWQSGIYSQWSGAPLATGIALFIPQFFGNQPLRIIHGIVMLVGCAWIAVVMWSERREQASVKSTRKHSIAASVQG